MLQVTAQVVMDPYNKDRQDMTVVNLHKSANLICDLGSQPAPFQLMAELCFLFYVSCFIFLFLHLLSCDLNSYELV